MSISYEGAASLIGHSVCHEAEDDFKELRPRAVMWQDDILAREVDGVLNGCFELNSTKDWATMPSGADGKKEQSSSF